MYRQSEKNLLNNNISSTCPTMANFGPLTAKIGIPIWGTPANFSGFRFAIRILPSLLQRRRSPEATKLCTMFGHLLGWYTMYTFSRALFCPLTEFCPVQNSLHVQVLRSPILAALLHGTSAAGVSHALRRGTRNGIAEVSQRAPPIFG